MSELAFFLSGIAFTSFLLSGVFFLKFWRASGDEFFKFLWMSCWLLGFERFVALTNFIIDPNEDFQTYSRPWIYLLRLIAFLLIIIPVVRRNYLSKKVL